jgi:hypothetical protein
VVVAVVVVVMAVSKRKGENHGHQGENFYREGGKEHY